MSGRGFCLVFWDAAGAAATGIADTDGAGVGEIGAADVAAALAFGEIGKSFTLLLYYSLARVIKNSPFLKSTLAMSPLSSLAIRI